ncbi:MAG: PilZ domain-containing protein [Pseudomonadota bacterium]
MLNLFRRSKSAAQTSREDLIEIDDRRVEGRRNVYADVVVKSDVKRALKRGVVLDLSAHGARIRLEYGDRFVDGMHVQIPRYSITVPAEVRWSNGQDIGVEFIG